MHEIQDLTAKGRKVLLIFDGYRSHMGLEVLQCLEHRGVIAYALPSHTSGTTQPLDVGILRPLKAHLDNTIQKFSVIGLPAQPVYDVFDCLTFITNAYSVSMTSYNIISTFGATGLCPVNPGKLQNVPRPSALAKASVILSVVDLEALMVLKRERRAAGLGICPMVTHTVYLDTSHGFTLTCGEALALVEAQELRRRKKGTREEEKSAIKDAKFAVRQARKRADLETWQRARLQYWVNTYGDPDVLPRPMKLRRIVAVKRTKVLKAAAFNSLHF